MEHSKPSVIRCQNKENTSEKSLGHFRPNIIYQLVLPNILRLEESLYSGGGAGGPEVAVLGLQQVAAVVPAVPGAAGSGGTLGLAGTLGAARDRDICIKKI